MDAPCITCQLRDTRRGVKYTARTITGRQHIINSQVLRGIFFDKVLWNWLEVLVVDIPLELLHET